MNIDLRLELVTLRVLAVAVARAAEAPSARRQNGPASAPARFGTAASRSPLREGSPQKAIRPPGRRTRRNSDNARSRSGMWWSTAWPKTRSKLSSANGSNSASVRIVPTSTPSRSAVLERVASIPGEMSEAIGRSIRPSCARLSVK